MARGTECFGEGCVYKTHIPEIFEHEPDYECADMRRTLRANGENGETEALICPYVAMFYQQGPQYGNPEMETLSSIRNKLRQCYDPEEEEIEQAG